MVKALKCELSWQFMPLSKALHSTCLVLGGHFKPLVPCACISDINVVCMLKNVTGYS